MYPNFREPCRQRSTIVMYLLHNRRHDDTQLGNQTTTGRAAAHIPKFKEQQLQGLPWYRHTLVNEQRHMHCCDLSFIFS